jgi:hypothetical protein
VRFDDRDAFVKLTAAAGSTGQRGLAQLKGFGRCLCLA